MSSIADWSVDELRAELQDAGETIAHLRPGIDLLATDARTTLEAVEFLHGTDRTRWQCQSAEHVAAAERRLDDARARLLDAQGYESELLAEMLRRSICRR